MTKFRSLFALIFLSALLSSGCASLRALMPGGVTPSDAEWSGVVTGPAVSIAAHLDQRAAAVEAILSLGQPSPLGVLLPVGIPGETTPRWILCTGDFVDRCRRYPVNTPIRFAGQAIGPGLLWRPSRLTASDG
jgi:hypothetical protein